MRTSMISKTDFVNFASRPPENFNLHLPTKRLRHSQEMEQRVLSLQQGHLSIQTKENIIKAFGGDLPSSHLTTQAISLSNFYNYDMSPTDNLRALSQTEATQKALLHTLDLRILELKEGKKP